MKYPISSKDLQEDQEYDHAYIFPLYYLFINSILAYIKLCYIIVFRISNYDIKDKGREERETR